MDSRYENLRTALRELGEIPLHEPPEGWEEYALHQRAACVATHAARLEAVAELQSLKASSAAPRQPEGPQDLSDAEIAWRERFWRASNMETASLDGLRLLAELKRRRARPADAAPLVALRRALEMAQAWFEDEEAGPYRPVLNAIRAALAAAPRDERLEELRLALEASERVGNYKEAHAMLIRAVRSHLAAAAPIGAPDARPDALRDLLQGVAPDDETCLLCGTRGVANCCPVVAAARAALAPEKQSPAAASLEVDAMSDNRSRR